MFANAKAEAVELPLSIVLRFSRRPAGETETETETDLGIVIAHRGADITTEVGGGDGARVVHIVRRFKYAHRQLIRAFAYLQRLKTINTTTIDRVMQDGALLPKQHRCIHTPIQGHFAIGRIFRALRK